MEYAYLIGEGPGRCGTAVHDTIEEIILPALADDGLESASAFPYGVSPGN
jgi:hypothetical protein